MKWSPKYVIGITLVVFGAIFFWFIQHYTLPLIYWDQWDVVEKVLRDEVNLSFLLTTHNEHRIGVGLVITKFLALATHWDNLAETYFIGLTITMSCLLALRLSWLLKGSWHISDVGIPLLFFTLAQHENLTWGFQIAFVLPLLWLMISLVTLARSPNRLRRDVVLLIISLLSAYSSFQGVFLPIIVSFYYLLSWLISRRWSARTCLFLALQVMVTVSYFYHFVLPAQAGGVTTLSEFFTYTALLITNTLTYHRHSILIGVFPFVMVGSFIYLIWRSVRKSELRHFPIIALFLYGFMFSLSAAYGRASLGLDQALSSRYVTFIIPLYLGLLLFGQGLDVSPKVKRGLLAVFVTILLLANLNAMRWAVRTAGIEKRASAWRSCYLERHTAEDCQLKTGFQLYPNLENGQIEKRLELLRERGANQLR